MQPEFADQIVERFEKGQLSRRQLVTRLMGLGAAMAVVPDAARGGEDGNSTLQAKGLNHIALTSATWSGPPSSTGPTSASGSSTSRGISSGSWAGATTTASSPCSGMIPPA